MIENQQTSVWGNLFKGTLCLWKDVEHGWMVEWCWGRVYFAAYYFLNKSVTNSSAFRQFERLLKRLLTSCVTRTLLMVTFTTTYFFAMDIAIHFSNKLRKYRTQLHLFMSKKSKLDAYCLAWKTLYVGIPLLLLPIWSRLNCVFLKAHSYVY